MGNCLKTQLKESVNNDNLGKLGTMCFTINPNERAKLQVSSSKAFKVKTDKYFVDSSDTNIGSEISIPAYTSGTVYIPSNMLHKIEITECYSLIDFIFDKGTAVVSNNDYSFLSNLYSLETFSQSIVTNDEINIEVCKDLTAISNFFAQTSEAYGDIATAFGKCGNIKDIRLGESRVSGSLESFVQKLRLVNPVNSTGISMPYIGRTNVTFDGQAIPYYGGLVLTWDATSITISDGINSKTVIA